MPQPSLSIYIPPVAFRQNQIKCQKKNENMLSHHLSELMNFSIFIPMPLKAFPSNKNKKYQKISSNFFI